VNDVLPEEAAKLLRAVTPDLDDIAADLGDLSHDRGQPR
jgi:hypothetical protein